VARGQKMNSKWHLEVENITQFRANAVSKAYRRDVTAERVACFPIVAKAKK
jgi:hypothetical protein